MLAACAGPVRDGVLAYEPSGRPTLTADGPPVSLSVSHSGSHTLVALARERALGADLERIRDLDVMAFSRLYFSAAESARVEATAAPERRGAFFAAWTRKEAYAKATGRGLTRSDALKTDLSPLRASPEVGTPVGFTADAREWCAFDLPLGPGYAGAIVVEGSARLRCWRPAGAA